VETMKDSNQFHAVCLDTYPPIFYLNDISKSIVHLFTKYNASSNSLKVAYTFDAGPNAVIYTLPQHSAQVLQLINFYFPIPNKSLSSENPPLNLCNFMDPQPNVLQDVIITKVGPGPQVLGDSEEISLIDFATGLPK